MLAVRHHDTRERNAAFVAHGVANDAERVFAARVIWHDVIGFFDIAVVDLVFRNERVYVDRVRALDLNSLKLVFLDLDVAALR